MIKETTCFYKHNVYKHTEPDFRQKFKRKLSISSVLNLLDQLLKSF